MCTDLRLVRVPDRHISARTLDFEYETGSRVQVVPRGQKWSAVPTLTAASTHEWTNDLGFVGMDGFGFDFAFCDGLNEAGLSVGTLWLPETDLPTTPPQESSQPVIDFINLAGWFLGTCRTVAEVAQALSTVAVWNAPIRRMWPAGVPVPDVAKPLLDYPFTEHLMIHDAHGGDLVIEFVGAGTGTGVRVYTETVGVLTNSPTYDWHLTNLRNYIGLTPVEESPVNLMGMPVTPTGNGSGLRGLPGDVTPPSRVVRATVLSEVVTEVRDTRDAVNQAFHSLDLVSVPRHLAASGDYTQWYVVRDHDNGVYYVRTFDAWTTHAHNLHALGVAGTGERSSLPLPTASGATAN